jgi:ATP-dependent Lon protease
MCREISEEVVAEQIDQTIAPKILSQDETIQQLAELVETLKEEIKAANFDIKLHKDITQNYIKSEHESYQMKFKMIKDQLQLENDQHNA